MQLHRTVLVVLCLLVAGGRAEGLAYSQANEELLAALLEQEKLKKSAISALSRQAAEEACQNAYVSLASREGLRGMSPQEFEANVRGAFYWEYKKSLRSNRAYVAFGDGSELAMKAAKDLGGAEGAALLEQRRIAIEYLRKAPPLERRIWRLRMEHNVPLERIAEELGMTRYAVEGSLELTARSLTTLGVEDCEAIPHAMAFLRTPGEARLAGGAPIYMARRWGDDASKAAFAVSRKTPMNRTIKIAKRSFGPFLLGLLVLRRRLRRGQQ
jgi:DNA-directed RNA polymerase specialized sigma24 family protein